MQQKSSRGRGLRQLEWGTMSSCPHPDDQQVRTVYYLMCSACQQVRLVNYCNYPTECHPKCTLAGVCVQEARGRYHADVPVEVDSSLR